MAVGKKTANSLSELNDGKQTIQIASSSSPSDTIDTEFVSDNFQTTDKDMEEVRAGMKILGIDTLATAAITSSRGKRLLLIHFIISIFCLFVFYYTFRRPALIDFIFWSDNNLWGE